MRIKAWAKVNLALNIVGRRPDGYHDLETVMHRIDLADDVEVVRDSDLTGAGNRAVGRAISGSDLTGAGHRAADRAASRACRPGITVTVAGVADLDVSGVPRDRGNVAFRAAQAFFEGLRPPGSDGRRNDGNADVPAISPRDSVSISIQKRIPVGAGLGGGSADAAAVLVAMNRLWGKPYGREKLMAIGASIGADVPFCLMNHDPGGDDADGSPAVYAAFAQGIGDRLTPLPGLHGIGLLLATPGFAVSTSDAYAIWDARFVQGARHESCDVRKPDAVCPPSRPTARRLAEALSTARSSGEHADASCDLQRVCSLMSNDFEPLIDERHGQIMQMKQLMMRAGAIGALMSGSGPTVFGVYGLFGQARAAVDVFGSLAADCGLDLNRDGFHVIAGCLGDFGF